MHSVSENSCEYLIEIFNDIEKIEKVRPIWEKMQGHPNSDIDFYLSIIKARKDEWQPYIILLSNKQQPKTMLIGRMEDRQIEIKIGYKVLLKRELRSLTIIYGGILGDNSLEASKILLSELMRTLEKNKIDIVYFNHISVEEPIYQLAKYSPKFYSRDFFPEHSSHWKSSLLGSYEKFYEARSKNTRHNLRRYAKLVDDKLGAKAKFLCLQNEEDFEKIINDTEKVASRTYHRSLEAGFIDNQVTRERVLLALKKKCYLAYIAYVDDEPCAFWNGIKYGDTYYAETTGYLPIYDQYHIGTWLLIKLVQNLCEKNISYIDFGFGDAQYKQNYCDVKTFESSIYIYAPQHKTIFLNLAKATTIKMSNYAENILIRWKLKDKIKTSWRKRLTQSNN